jgi:hypothetical protein
MTYGQCKNCKLPIEDDESEFCDNDNLCWELWCRKMDKQDIKLENKKHDPVELFEEQAKKWLEMYMIMRPRSYDLAKLLCKVYDEGYEDGMHAEKQARAEVSAASCEGGGSHCEECIGDHEDCCLCGKPAVRLSK